MQGESKETKEMIFQANTVQEAITKLQRLVEAFPPFRGIPFLLKVEFLIQSARKTIRSEGEEGVLINHEGNFRISFVDVHGQRIPRSHVVAGPNWTCDDCSTCELARECTEQIENLKRYLLSND